jgi:hypothetical protein
MGAVILARGGSIDYPAEDRKDGSGGRVYVNRAPKDGRNTLHGEFFSVYVNHAFVETNLDSTLIARGITARPGSDTPA